MKQNGTVKFFNAQKGYGFITSDDGTEIFVHKSGTLDVVKKDDRVTYTVEMSRKGYKAINVKRLNMY